MTISQVELGARLRQARKSVGLTQDQVGRELGISWSAVTNIENGARALSSLELDRLAFCFGRDIRDFFAAEFGAENALFCRNLAIADDPKSMSALRHCMAVGRELTNLERLVGIDRDEQLLELPEADHAKERNRFRHRFLSLALQAYGRAAISRGKLEELFAIVLEKKREEVNLADFVANVPPTPVEIPSVGDSPSRH